MADQAQLETLSTALTSALLAESVVRGGDLSSDAVRAEIRTTNVMLDACIEAGMSHDEPSHIGWASQRVAEWLCSASEEV